MPTAHTRCNIPSHLCTCSCDGLNGHDTGDLYTCGSRVRYRSPVFVEWSIIGSSNICRLLALAVETTNPVTLFFLSSISRDCYTHDLYTTLVDFNRHSSLYHRGRSAHIGSQRSDWINAIQTNCSSQQVFPIFIVPIAGFFAIP